MNIEYNDLLQRFISSISGYHVTRSIFNLERPSSCMIRDVPGTVVALSPSAASGNFAGKTKQWWWSLSYMAMIQSYKVLDSHFMRVLFLCCPLCWLSFVVGRKCLVSKERNRKPKSKVDQATMKQHRQKSQHRQTQFQALNKWTLQRRRQTALTTTCTRKTTTSDQRRCRANSAVSCHQCSCGVRV
jgi:hypothetical protein